MPATDATREKLLDAYGRFYGEQHFAVAFTAAIAGDNAKRVTTEGWDKTTRLADGDFGAALVSGRGKRRNPVIVLRPSELIALESDSEPDLARISALGLPETLTVRSSEPYKRHYYFRPDPLMETVPYVAFRFEPGKLTADSGRYFLAPPSIHPSGAVYSFIPKRGPGEVEIATLPEEVYRQLSEQARVEASELKHAIETDPEAKIRAGTRRDLIFRYACMLRRWGLSEAAILESCLHFNETRCEPPVERHLVQVQVDGAMKKRGGQELARAMTLEDEAYDAAEPDPESPYDPPRDPGGWTRIDLADDIYAVPADPPAVEGLLYATRRHVISGPPESAKTLITYILLLLALRDGAPVAIIDFEMGPVGSRRLLTDLGATLDELRAIYYVTPETPPIDGLTGIIDSGSAYVMIDAAIGAYDASGLDDNARKDAEQFARTWVKPLWDAGRATLIVDHVTKNTETRGKFTIGSERKLGSADVHLGLEALKTLSRGGSGLIKVHVHKDRPGFLPRPHAAVIELISDETTHQVTWTFRAPAATDPSGDHFRPTHLMEKVSRWMELHHGSCSRNEVEKGVRGNSEYVRQALDMLTFDGYISETAGPRRARIVSIMRPFREKHGPEEEASEPGDNPGDNPTSSEFVRVRPDGEPPTSSTSSPPYGGTGRATDEVDEVTSSVHEDEVTEPNDGIPF